MEASRDTDDGDLYSQLANAYASDDDLVVCLCYLLLNVLAHCIIDQGKK